ncbi:MAG: hypothetical protein WCG64_04920 [Flavobacteriia bacterium]|jgi:hypothetical protein
MKIYNKIMLYFWLLAAIGSFVIVTFNGITEGFARWTMYYTFTVMALLMFVMKRYMVKRFEKHQSFLNEQNSSDKK